MSRLLQIKNEEETETMDVFADRLSNLMNITKTEQKVLAEYCCVTRQTISAYTKKRAIPTIHILKKIATFFSTTSDYLLGLSDIEKINEPQQNTRIFSECNEILEFKDKLKNIMEEYKIYDR